MASSAVEDNQPPQMPSPMAIQDIWTTVSTGVRILMSSNMLDQLVMALAVSTVNDCTIAGMLSYDETLKMLKAAGKKCSKRGDDFWFYKRENLCLALLKELSHFDSLKVNNTLRFGSIRRIFAHVKSVLKERDERKDALKSCGLINNVWKFRESPLFTEADRVVQTLYELEKKKEEKQLKDAMRKLKIAAVHEICVSMGVGWVLFQKKEDCGYLFYDKRWNNFWTTKDNLTAYNLIEYLSNSRRFTAHYRTLSDGPGDIGIFMNQFTSMQKMLNQYFQEVPGQDSQKEAGRRLGNCYSDLKAIMDNRSELAEDKENLTKQVCSLKEEKQQMDLKTWSVITQYYLNRHQPTIADDPIYKGLLLLIQNHENITSLPAQDGQPLKDLRTLHGPKDTAVEAAAAPTEVTARQAEQGSEIALTEVDHADQPTDYVGESKTTKKK